MERTVIIFFVITLINVVLSTAKSIMTVKSSRIVATIINAVSYGFYALVVKQMSSVNLETVVIVTVICNLIGVYFSMWLLDRFKKDVLWKVTVIPETDKVEVIKDNLIKNGLGFNEYKINTKYGNQVGLDIFSETQSDSAKLKEILDKNGRVKYHILEIKNQL